MSDRTSLPWFPLYVANYLLATRGWPIAARACYIELLAVQWDRGGLPADPDELRSLVEPISNDDWTACVPHVETAFPVDADGVRRNYPLEMLRGDALQIREARRRGASKTNQKRWGGRVVPIGERR